MKQCFDEFIELYGNEFLKNLYKGMYESVAEHRLWADEFTINLEKKWFTFAFYKFHFSILSM